MDLEDAPKKPTNMVIGENLDAISVAELEQRIQSLESEIERLKAEIAKKQAAATPPTLSSEIRLTALTIW